MEHESHGRAVLFTFDALKFVWYASLAAGVLYFAYILADSAFEPPQPTRLELLCADLESLSEKAETDTERARIEDVRAEYCPP